MSNGWSETLTYTYLERLLDAIRERFELRPLRDGLAGPGGAPRALVRHDIDVCLQSALRLAERESGWGLASTYLVQVDCPLYELDGRGGRDALDRLAGLGHEVGLHVDVGSLESDALEARVTDARARLEALAGAPVRSVSFHRPAPGLLRGPPRVGGMLNAYGEELMETYMSDSEGRFRNGDPLPLVAAQRGRGLQLLIHPIWWGERHLTPADRLQEFFEESTRGMAQEQAGVFDAELVRAVEPATRSGLS